jgi:hypothetical protein
MTPRKCKYHNQKNPNSNFDGNGMTPASNRATTGNTYRKTILTELNIDAMQEQKEAMRREGTEVQDCKPPCLDGWVIVLMLFSVASIWPVSSARAVAGKDDGGYRMYGKPESGCLATKRSRRKS